MARLSSSDREELITLLSASKPSQYGSLGAKTTNRAVRSVIHWYVPLPKDEEAIIWRQAKLARLRAIDDVSVPEDELVEDAGLAEVA